MHGLRVERALGLLPAGDMLDPLRALLASTTRNSDAMRWASGGPYATLGKHEVDVDVFRRRMEALLPRVTAHITAMYGAYARALEAAQAGDDDATVAALMDAGASEERMDRIAHAHAWYETALQVASELLDRRPEIDVLDQLGRTARSLTRHGEAARHHQHALELAEAASDRAATISACVGLGHAALARDELRGAEAWFTRALAQAEAGTRPSWIGTIEHHLGWVRWRLRDGDGARYRLQRARDVLEPLGAHEELARVHCTLGRVELGGGNSRAAVASGREALAWLRRANADAGQRIDLLIQVSDMFVAAGELVAADDLLREAESGGIAAAAGARLADVYAAMGRLAGVRGDQTGFVFFEQAMDLCRAFAPGSTNEARLCEQYGNFRLRFGEHDEGHAHLERARSLFETNGEAA